MPQVIDHTIKHDLFKVVQARSLEVRRTYIQASGLDLCKILRTVAADCASNNVDEATSDEAGVITPCGPRRFTALVGQRA